jgi:hypothetical protein
MRPRTSPSRSLRWRPTSSSSSAPATRPRWNLIGWYFDMRQNPVTDLNIALRAAGAEPTAAPTGTPRSGPVASASWSAQCRASTADSAPDGDHSDSARLCEAVVDVVPRLGHQHAPMFAAGHRLVDDAALGCETDLIQCRSELIVEERAGSRRFSRHQRASRSASRRARGAISSFTGWPAASPRAPLR